MPLYDYQCRTCQKVTEVRHGFKEVHRETCPDCGGSDMARVFNAAPILFKGSGFYVTDSRKSPPPRPVDGGAEDRRRQTDGAQERRALPRATGPEERRRGSKKSESSAA